MSNKGFAVAIDGPVGVGKSTTARKIAEKLGIIYIDTGAMYRAVALYNMELGTDIKSTVEQSIDDINIELRYIEGLQHVYLNGKDVTDKIRTPAVSENASVVAAFKSVREKLVAQQQKMAETGSVVMDGRDIASHVLPWAQVKIYLDADLDIRAQRRLLDLQSKGILSDTFEDVRNDTHLRDQRDKNRENSPLIRTADAICIDTGTMTHDEVVENIITIVKQRGYI